MFVHTFSCMLEKTKVFFLIKANKTYYLAIIGPFFMKINRIRLDFIGLFDYAVTIFGGV
jgi:hypothetical protein